MRTFTRSPEDEWLPDVASDYTGGGGGGPSHSGVNLLTTSVTSA